MTSRPPILRILAGLIAALAMTLVAPSPAQAVTVTITASRPTAPPSIPVTFSGNATGAPTGGAVTLQRRQGSGAWSTVKTGGKVSSSKTYAFTIYVALGKYSYRAKVGSSAYSPATSVTGRYGQNVAPPAAGAPFTLSARLPKPWVRLVKAQVSTNGTTWTTRGQATSNSTGWVGIRTYLTSTSYVRVIAPATSSLPAWVGARGQITIGIDPVIKKILDDTNAHRAANGGKSALVLHPSLNKVAGNWAYYMHQTCTFKHNPNFAAQYPSGWKGAAENIAAGQTYTTVVNGGIVGVQSPSTDVGWIDSPPHRTNILGDYTHIGIGYYFGSKCNQRYYVQNFAKY